jgi:hypothetical protein
MSKQHVAVDMGQDMYSVTAPMRLSLFRASFIGPVIGFIRLLAFFPFVLLAGAFFK